MFSSSVLSRKVVSNFHQNISMLVDGGGGGGGGGDVPVRHLMICGGVEGHCTLPVSNNSCSTILGISAAPVHSTPVQSSAMSGEGKGREGYNYFDDAQLVLSKHTGKGNR